MHTTAGPVTQRLMMCADTAMLQCSRGPFTICNHQQPHQINTASYLCHGRSTVGARSVVNSSTVITVMAKSRRRRVALLSKGIIIGLFAQEMILEMSNFIFPWFSYSSVDCTIIGEGQVNT